MPTASILTISDTRSAGSRADTTTAMMAELAVSTRVMSFLASSFHFPSRYRMIELGVPP